MRTGIYLMKIRDMSGDFHTFSIRCEIIGESEKSFHIVITQRGPMGQHVGTKYWVRKRNVVEQESSRTSFPNYEIRKPYIE